MLKSGGDGLTGVRQMSLLLAVLAAPALFFISLSGPEVWPYLAASVVLHTIYKLILVCVYRLGDMSQIYPIVIHRPRLAAVFQTTAGWSPTLTSAVLCLLAFWVNHKNTDRRCGRPAGDERDFQRLSERAHLA